MRPVKSHKFLGVIIDEELRFKEQLASAVAKGTKYALACRRLAKPSLGIKNKFTCTLFNSVVIPKMLYGVNVWGAKMTASLGKRAGRKGQGKILERVLHTHAITTSGAMRTTATDTAVAHANLTPMPFTLHKISHQRNRHKSPLHFLVKAFGTHPKNTEEILPLRRSPKWTPNVTTLIADKKEDAIRDAERADEVTQIFTDRSGYQGGIGAAVVLRGRGKPERVLHFHLGSNKHYTVFNGEQIGMLLGIELLRKEHNVQSVYMGVDNQATILTTTSSHSSSSHSLTDMFTDSLNSILDKHDLPHLAIHWKAAEGDSSPVEQLPTSLRKRRTLAVLPYSKAALIQSFNAKLKAEIKADFTSTERGKCLWRLDPTMLSSKFAALATSPSTTTSRALRKLNHPHA
ncbi:hypothetical protein SCLCIDRAFT_26221 [Scleroderma citrinum Foug A]|uniref:RNase H type-1 domain-containing protein n=1 Tax=Scleroderma citrinum Foug A TaxID=1036808 RepID=A0A0C3DY48_9AGAM|nr:hypothetical protein SCLCIDRAFT_26221 [Scleroderma citrinum Foug A]